MKKLYNVKLSYGSKPLAGAAGWEIRDAGLVEHGELRLVGRFNFCGRGILWAYWTLVKIVDKLPAHDRINWLQKNLGKCNPSLFLLFYAPDCIRNLFFKFNVAELNRSNMVNES